MINFTNFEKINDEAYVWRNFIGDELTNDLFAESELISQAPAGTDDKNGYAREDRPGDRIQLLHGKVDQRIVDKINNFFEGTIYDIRYFLHWHAPKNVWFAIHRDEEAFDPTPLKKAWGGVLYLSDMDGGELFYPINNTWFKPGKGDLVLHTASIAHGAVEVNGDNKRFITFVVYDKTQSINPNDHLSMEEEAEITWETIKNSKEWLKSDIGIKWRKKYNFGLTE
jgi:hypothetical protein